MITVTKTHISAAGTPGEYIEVELEVADDSPGKQESAQADLHFNLISNLDEPILSAPIDATRAHKVRIPSYVAHGRYHWEVTLKRKVLDEGYIPIVDASARERSNVERAALELKAQINMHTSEANLPATVALIEELADFHEDFVDPLYITQALAALTKELVTADGRDSVAQAAIKMGESLEELDEIDSKTVGCFCALILLFVMRHYATSKYAAELEALLGKIPPLGFD